MTSIKTHWVVAILFVILINICIYIHMNINTPVEDIFNQETTKIEKQLFLELLETFDGLAKSVNLTYFLVDGSLIGSVRHHGLIPWDDDIDLGLLVTEKPKLLEIFRLLPPHITGHSHTVFRWKICFTSRPGYRFRLDLPWSHPFLDIAFYNLDLETNLTWDQHSTQFGTPRVSTDVIFPVIRRPFMGLELPVPAAPEQYLQLFFQTDVMTDCSSLPYSHRRELPVNPLSRRTVPCETLHDLYPFVVRQVLGDHGASRIVNESLVLNGTVLHSLVTYY